MLLYLAGFVSPILAARARFQALTPALAAMAVQLIAAARDGPGHAFERERKEAEAADRREPTASSPGAGR
jgi:hypothetical protein